MSRLTRRSFLSFLALLPGMSLAKPREQYHQHEQTGPVLSQRRQHILEAVIGPYKSIVEVGNACRQLSLEHKYSAWSRQFTGMLDERVNTKAGKDLVELRDSYQLRVKADFHEGRTTLINGYVLSDTEVEICCWAADAASI